MSSTVSLNLPTCCFIPSHSLRCLSHYSGISSAYGGVLSALEVVYTLTPSPAEAVRGSRKHGGVKQLIERETVRAVYEGRTDVISQRERTLEV